MAKTKVKPEEKEPPSKAPVYKTPASTAWASVLGALNEADAEKGRRGVFVGKQTDNVSIGLPLSPFALQWLLQDTCFVLGRGTMLLGQSGSCKSAMLFEMMGWHFPYGTPAESAVVSYLMTEGRDQPSLRRSQVGDTYADLVIMPRMEVLEDWQIVTTRTVQSLRKLYAKTTGPTVPFFDGVDSLTGTTSQRNVDKIEEDGHASASFAIDANLMNMYYKYIHQQICQWPISFVVTNHIKYTPIQMPGGRVHMEMRIPGGAALVYHANTALLLKRIGEVDRQDVAGGNKLIISNFKNSQGERNKELEVEMVWWYDTATGEQTTRFDWDAATVRLLRKLAESGNYPKLQGVVEFPIYNAAARSCSCPQLGIRKPQPFAEVGRQIAADPDIMASLQVMFGIRKSTVFRPGIGWFEQVSDAIAKAEQDVAADSAATIDVVAGAAGATEESPAEEK